MTRAFDHKTKGHIGAAGELPPFFGAFIFRPNTSQQFRAVSDHVADAGKRPVAMLMDIASALTDFQYDVAPDGRFLVNSHAAQLTLMTGWTDRLRR